MGRILVIERSYGPEGVTTYVRECWLHSLFLRRHEWNRRHSALPTAGVLDLCLPVRHGKEVCRDLKSKYKYSSLPVIILSAVTDVSDKVLLLELGADDYITKPFSPRELLARVEAAIRRSVRPTAKGIFAFGDRVVNFTAMTVIRRGLMVQLTPQEFKLLKFLLENQDRVVTRDELLNEVWGYESYPSTRTVDNHVLRLRHKLEKDPTEPLHFRTVHSVGYSPAKARRYPLHGRELRVCDCEFEVLLAFAVAYSSVQNKKHFWGPVGRFGWKYRLGDSPLNTVVNIARAEGEHWAPLKSGLFPGANSSPIPRSGRRIRSGHRKDTVVLI